MLDVDSISRRARGAGAGTPYPGIGLGLAIARDFARAMGGDLRLESEAGKGTTALLELPSA